MGQSHACQQGDGGRGYCTLL